MKYYTTQQLADLAHVSARTLRYYDKIDLLKPSSIADNGYRQYAHADLLRLQAILFYKELDFALDDIRFMVSHRNFDPTQALIDQKLLLKSRQARLGKLIKKIDQTVDHLKHTHMMKDEELYDVFADESVANYQNEVKQRWGDTDAYKESMKRVARMTKDEMAEIKEAGERLCRKMVDHMALDVRDPAVRLLVEEHRAGIELFYDCSPEMHKNLAQMYIDDPRFTAYYDAFKPGLARFLRDAIFAYYQDAQNKS